MVCFYGFYASIKAKELKVLTKNHKNIDFSGNYWVSYRPGTSPSQKLLTLDMP